MSIFKIDSRLKSLIFFALVGFFIVSSVLVVNYFLLAWTEPGAAPPNGHVGINTLDAADSDPVDAVYVDDSGNVGIGNTSPSALLDVSGNLKVGPFYFDGDDDSWLRLRDSDGGSYKDLAVGNFSSSANGSINQASVGATTFSGLGERLRIYDNGGWGGLLVQNNASDANLVIAGNGGGSLSTLYLTSSGANPISAASWFMTLNKTSWDLWFGNYVGGISEILMDMDHDSQTVYFPLNVRVDGNFSVGGTKAFKIDHPTKPGKELVYASLEGPENGVYVRGKMEDKKVIILPDYWTGLVREDSITVQLTPVGSSQNLWVEKIKDNKVYINSDAKNLNYFYFIQGERKDIDKLEVEIDK